MPHFLYSQEGLVGNFEKNEYGETLFVDSIKVNTWDIRI